ncbi:MAG: hypothetical protein M1816_004802, partial [Peltula sp. TS41687]
MTVRQIAATTQTLLSILSALVKNESAKVSDITYMAPVAKIAETAIFRLNGSFNVQTIGS